ncbi:MAG: GAF domain-containing protein, partial [Candidatus Eremiobacteraeota bacterium]|nr:GAF domain-containing protein [Candidatus Eremiobacteraeota bacterium]
METTLSPQHLLAALDVFPTPAIITFGEGGRAFINRPLAAMVNLPEHTRELDLDALPYRVVDSDGELASKNFPLRRAMRGESLQIPLIIKPRGENPVHVVVFARPIRNDSGSVTGAIATFFDVREQRRIEAEKRSTQARLDRSAERLLYLARAGEALSETLNVDAVLSTLEQLVIPRLAKFAFILLLDDQNRPAETRVYHAESERLAKIREIIAELRLSPWAFQTATRIARTGVGELVPSIDALLDADKLPNSYRAWIRRFVDETDLHQSMGVPLRAHGQTIGVLFVADSNERPYTDEDLRFLEEVARRAASAIENAQSYERQQRALEMMQRALLPAKLPRVPEFAFDVVYVPGDDEALIGGDWY